jgi:transposase-like protein
MADKKLDLRNPIFHDDNKAREHLEALLWPQGPLCPRCGVMGDRITKLQGASTRPGVYKCKDCRKPFSVTVGTVMERSHIPLSKWVLAAQLMASSKKSMSAHQLHRMLGTNYETAWFLFHRLREAANDLGSAGPLGGTQQGRRGRRNLYRRQGSQQAQEQAFACRARSCWQASRILVGRARWLRALAPRRGRDGKDTARSHRDAS